MFHPVHRGPSLNSLFTAPECYILAALFRVDHEDGEVDYLEVRSALTCVDTGESYRSVASDISHLSRVSLSQTDKDDQRREWYLDAAAEVEQIDEALDQMRADEYTDCWFPGARDFLFSLIRS